MQKKNKIRIGYTPEVLTDATADMAFALLIDSLRRISEGDRIIRKGKWRQIYGAYDYVGLDLQGKTLGIIGLGRIGKTLAKRAKAFDMKIIYHNRKQISKIEEKKLGAKYTTFDKLITQSDIISIHVPHTKETNQMFDMKIFKKMKKTAFLINTSRGKIVNEKDLAVALKLKIMGGAGLDVFETEPIKKNHSFLKLENIVLAPHVGSSTKETRIKMAEITIKNLILGMNGKKPIYSIGYWLLRVSVNPIKCWVFILKLWYRIKLKKFKHTNEELELAKIQTEKEKKKKESEDWYFFACLFQTRFFLKFNFWRIFFM